MHYFKSSNLRNCALGTFCACSFSTKCVIFRELLSVSGADPGFVLRGGPERNFSDIATGKFRPQNWGSGGSGGREVGGSGGREARAPPSPISAPVYISEGFFSLLIVKIICNCKYFAHSVASAKP